MQLKRKTAPTMTSTATATRCHKSNYYDNDDLLVSVLDLETNETLGYIDITDEDEINYNLN